MTFYKWLALVAAMLTSVGLWSQPHQHSAWCGMHRADLDALTERLQENLALYDEYGASLRSETTTWIPLRIHVVNRNDGTGGAPLSNILEMLCSLNESFEDQQIQFFIKGAFNTINNTNLFNNPTSQAGTQLMANNRVTGFMNIFLINQMAEPGTLGYYAPFHDIVVIRRSEVAYGRFTLDHEAGHFLSLVHTFNGWECEPYNPNLHGNPVNINVAPCQSLLPPFSNPLIELADGSNGTISGDFLGDTPADYNFGLGAPGCAYNGSALDKNGVPLSPDPNNMMGYFRNCPTYHFSTMQKNVMATDLNTRKNLNPGAQRYLNTNVVPITAPTGPVDPLFPPDQGQSNGLTNVALQWEAGPGATDYIVRIDRFSSFTFNPQIYFVKTNSVTLDFPLVDGANYFWQVYPYNNFNFCSRWGAETYRFQASQATSTQSIPGLDAWQLHPNPAAVGQPLTLTYDAWQDVTGDLEIMDVQGRILHQERGIWLPAGEQQRILSWQPTAAGVYFLRLVHREGLITQKMVAF
jgi:hypothetical protein